MPVQLSNGPKAIAPYLFVDYPGHLSQRLRIKEHFTNLRAVVFVADAAAAVPVDKEAAALSTDGGSALSWSTEQLSAIAAYLYTLLTDAAFVKRRAPVSTLR